MKTVLMKSTSAGPGSEDNLLAGCTYTLSDAKATSLVEGGYAEFAIVQPSEKAVVAPVEKAVITPPEKATTNKAAPVSNASVKAPTWGSSQ